MLKLLSSAMGTPLDSSLPSDDSSAVVSSEFDSSSSAEDFTRGRRDVLFVPREFLV